MIHNVLRVFSVNLLEGVELPLSLRCSVYFKGVLDLALEVELSVILRELFRIGEGAYVLLVLKEVVLEIQLYFSLFARILPGLYLSELHA